MAASACRWLQLLGLVLLAEGTSRDSVPYNPSTHVPIKSKGCGKTPPYPIGKSTEVNATLQGVTWTYVIYLPVAYDPNVPMPLVFQCPGWGISAPQEEAAAGIAAHADLQGFVSVTPQGQGDNSDKTGGPWYSWNAVGSTQSPGPAGPTCTNAANNKQYCYESCSCPEFPQCDWTTCHDGITPSGTGTSNASGFIATLWDTLEEQLCIDTTREFQAGESNGGMMTYQTGVDLATRFAAIFPQFGSFHNGFNLAPAVGLPVMDLHGFHDTTVPANATPPSPWALAADGYYYTPNIEIFGGNNFSSGWMRANNCSGPPRHYPTQFDGILDLYCVSMGTCTGGDVVRCGWDGGHNWFAGTLGPQYNGGLVTEFLFKWAKPSHIGRGYSLGEELGPPRLFEAARIVAVRELPRVHSVPIEIAKTQAGRWPPPAFVQSKAMHQRNHGPHYSDPADGCRGDESVLPLAGGWACAPKILSTRADNDVELPVPHCILGDVRPEINGCPHYHDGDHGFNTSWKLFPVCLAKGGLEDSNPYMRGNFHCMLRCPCDGVGVFCGGEADKLCPGSSVCRRGELRHLAYGVCTYHAPRQAQAGEIATVVV